MVDFKKSKNFYLQKAARVLSLVIIPVIAVYFAFTVLAGTLSPGAPPAATMKTLEEIYSALAGASYTPPAVTPSVNGNALQLIKCITNHMASGLGWYQTGGAWGYRKSITIDKDKVSNTNQTNFPVLVSITDTDLKDTSQASPGHVGQSDGGDIFFTSSNGTTKLSHEIEKYDNTTGNLIAWVKVPVLSASVDTVIYLYYGNASIANQWDTANVWDSNYKMVQHLSDATTSTTTDSTSNANNGTKVAANEPIETSLGQINKAQSFDGGNDYVDLGTPASLDFMGSTGTYSISLWFYKTSLGTEKTIFAKTISSDDRITINVYNSDNKIRAHQRIVSTDYGATSDAAITANTWYYIVFTFSSNVSKLWVNSVLQSATNSASTVSTVGTRIGSVPGGGLYWDGDIDEVRISSSVRSADWIVTEYNNQSLPSAFYNLGIEENFGC